MGSFSDYLLGINQIGWGGMQSNRHQNLLHSCQLKVVSRNYARITCECSGEQDGPWVVTISPLLSNEPKKVLQRILVVTPCHEKIQGIMLVKVFPQFLQTIQGHGKSSQGTVACLWHLLHFVCLPPLWRQ